VTQPTAWVERLEIDIWFSTVLVSTVLAQEHGGP